MSTTIDTLISAKAARDHVRTMIVRAMRGAVELPAELEILLAADERATADLSAAVAADLQAQSDSRF